MVQNSAVSRTAAGKHLILVVDDELVNREILKMILEQEYDTLTAQDGESALDIIRENSERLSLILLDLLMPGMHGLEVLHVLQEDPALKHIPVIVLTADQKAETESLRAGAVDFLTKPYPPQEVILARVQRTIELAEDRELIEFTERDRLTGLLNRDYFYRYAEQFDLHRPDRQMDAMLLDICHFHMVNERYGKAFGDQVLVQMGESLRSMIRSEGGIVSRRNADTFLVYCPHREDYQAILDGVIKALPTRNNGSRIRLRMGVYAEVDRKIDMERRFDRAKMAADTLIGSYRTTFAVYDHALHENEVFSERLLEGFDEAIQEKQFRVYFQPKVDVRPDKPVLASAEALVRWIHPELGFISPGKFIPLFEQNGLISRLDQYVWRETARQIREWKDRLGISVPVSVNVSRIDMFDPELVQTLLQLLREYRLTPEDLYLEITESAYTGDSSQIIEKVKQLRKLGFHIEMDDFGTGYSSLNMISELPIDALKLDMIFIRTAFSENGDMRLIGIIIDIADFLNVPVIAEGVETAEQMKALREMGCDLVQGYYFSKPVPADVFETFLTEKQRRLAEEGEEAVYRRTDRKAGIRERHPGSRNETGGRVGSEERRTLQTIAQALSSDFETAYYVDTLTDDYQEFTSGSHYQDLKMDLSGTHFFDESRKNIVRVLYPEDQERVAALMEKESILRQLAARQSLSADYRLMIENAPVWHRMKIVLAENSRYLVIGVANVDAEHTRAEKPAPAEDGRIGFAAMAEALAADYFSIICVDMKTDRFIAYSAQGGDGMPGGIRKEGSGFFGLARADLARTVHPEDRDSILEAFTKENLKAEMNRGGSYTLSCRLVTGDKTNYVSMKAVRLADRDDRHLVIGVNNINAQMQRQQESSIARAGSDMYARITQALSREYYSIYLIHEKTEEFIKYTFGPEDQRLQVVQKGTDFFRTCRQNLLRLAHREDLERVLALWDKNRLLPELDHGKTFSFTYRLMMNEDPVYISVKLIRMTDEMDNRYIVVGVSNVDEQMKREQELIRIREKANRDPLTGTKSRHAYGDAVAEINTRVDQGKIQPFAVVACDVNGLKRVNETQGRQAGDQLIIDAARKICGVFKRSPVYRVGGDEFVVILRGTDYELRNELMEAMQENNGKGPGNSGPGIACGLSEWRPGLDNRFEAVFDRADNAMYEDKKRRKKEAEQA